jgi:hemerythrin-like domain-containing protein
MCEYCGCQSVATIAELTREHDAVVTLVGRVRAARQAGDVSAVASLARDIAAILGPHTQVEENGLFPAMAIEFPGQIAALEAEHRRIEGVLAEAADGVPTDLSWPERLTDVLALLRNHILKEQDGVFPAALATLSVEQWEAAEAVRAATATAVTGRAA